MVLGPNDTKQKDVRAGYKSLAASITQLNEVGAVPLSVHLLNHNEGDEIEDTVRGHSAK